MFRFLTILLVFFLYQNAYCGTRSLEKLTPIDAFSQDGGCDVLVLRSGEEIDVKLIEVSNSSIKYKKCNNTDGPDFVLSKDDVFMIRYTNGDKEVFNTANRNNQDKKPNFFAIFGFIFSIVALALSFNVVLGLFVAITSLILSSMGFYQTTKYRDVYKNRGLAIAGMIISIVGIIGLIQLAS